MQDVRDKIALIRPGFPREVKDPLVLRGDFDNAQPVVSLAVTSSTRSLRELTTLTDQVIVKRFQNVPGVGQVQESGGVARQVLVNLKPAQMQSQGVGVDEIIGAIQAANMDVPAGQDRAGPERAAGARRGQDQGARRASARSSSRAAPRARCTSTRSPTSSTASARPIRSRASTASPGPEPQRAQGAGREHRGGGRRREGRRRGAEEDAAGRREDLEIVYADVDFIEKALNGVKETIVEGALLTVFIVFLFLHSWRSTIITGLTLPISVIATFIAVYVFGFTLNFLTLMALSLCIGLLIDDAIVVRENIVRHLGMGKDHFRAAREGTEEIGLAVMATTFAIVAVFVPVAFMKGIIGKFFFQFGITVAVAVLVSLFVSFTLDPMLSSIWRDPPERPLRALPLARADDGAHRGRHRVGPRALRRSSSNGRSKTA